MNFASQELSLELYKLSDWEGINVYGGRIWLEEIKAYLPYYNLGYLLRRLPRKLRGKFRLTIQPGVGNKDWSASYQDVDGILLKFKNHYWFEREKTVEDAACKLAI